MKHVAILPTTLSMAYWRAQGHQIAEPAPVLTPFARLLKLKKDADAKRAFRAMTFDFDGPEAA